jgi:ATP-dependent Clp protease ATP-binding subunit ClpC
MFERYTDRAKRAVELAQGEAAGLGHDAVGTEHLLLGLVNEGGGVAFTALDALGVTAKAAGEAVWRRHRPGSRPSAGWLPYAPRFKVVAELALRESVMLGHNFIGTEHLLLALIRDADDSEGAQALADCGMAAEDEFTLDDVRAKVLELLRGYADAERAASPALPATTVRPGDQQALAWELVGRMRKFLGHIKDMCDDERLFMLGALTGSLEGTLRDAGVPEPAGDGRT